MANETPSGTGASADLADISFEDALRELEAIVESLEHGDVSRLEEARMKVEQIQVPSDGGAPESAAPFSADE